VTGGFSKSAQLHEVGYVISLISFLKILLNTLSILFNNHSLNYGGLVSFAKPIGTESSEQYFDRKGGGDDRKLEKIA
jgi:hypothetical protein